MVSWPWRGREQDTTTNTVYYAQIMLILEPDQLVTLFHMGVKMC